LDTLETQAVISFFNHAPRADFDASSIEIDSPSIEIDCASYTYMKTDPGAQTEMQKNFE
jgi:hypothetical protein